MHNEIADELTREICKALEYRLWGKTTKYRAIIKEVDDWWIGWLVDLPGVNAQEKIKEELIID